MGPALREGLVYLLVFLAWSWWVQSFANPWTLVGDVACAVAAGAAVALALRRAGLAAKRTAGVRPWLAILACWILISTVDTLRDVPLSRSPERFAAPVASRALQTDLGVEWPNERVGLALSGGGYRAAVFHAGVLHQLEELGIRPTHLSVVSGGAIIGSFYATGGRPTDLADAVASGRFNLRRRMARIQNALRLPFPMTIPFTGGRRLAPFYDFSRLDVQAELLRDLVLGRGDGAACDGCPELLVNATDLRYAAMVGMMDEGIVVSWPPGQDHFYRADVTLSWPRSFDLAARVAISGAFPGAFPAHRASFEIARGRPVGAGSARVARELFLVDGGVGDNSGLRLLEATRALASPRHPTTSQTDPAARLDAAWQLDAVLVSNAGALFSVAARLSALAELTRAVDVIAQQNLNLALSRRGLSMAETDRLAERACREPEPPYPADPECTPKLMSLLSRHQSDGATIVIGPQRALDAIDRSFTSAPEATPGAPSREPNAHFNPVPLPTPLLRAVAGRLPSREQRLQAALDVAAIDRARRAIVESHERPAASRAPHRTFNDVSRHDDDRSLLCPCPRATPDELLVCAGARLRNHVAAEFARVVETFQTTDTLDDQLGAERARALFDLGRLEVLFAWPRLRRALLHEPTGGRQGDAFLAGLELPIRPLEQGGQTGQRRDPAAAPLPP